MAPVEWAVGAQKLYLEGLLVPYGEAAQNNQFFKFWPKMSEGWFLSWPEAQPLPEPEAVVDPDDANPPVLSLDQRLEKAMAKAISKRINVRSPLYVF
jgi:hypothetical protein